MDHLNTSAFLDTLHSKDPKLSTRFAAYRNQKGRGLSEIEVSAILTGTAPHLSAFVGWLFGIEDQLKELRLRTDRESVIFRFKKEFVSCYVFFFYRKRPSMHSCSNWALCLCVSNNG